jgi:hypothetical protein
VTGDESAVLQDLLAAEHAAVYAYGLLGARLDETTRTAALAAFDAHRARRDALIAVLQTAGAEAPAPALGYDAAVGTRPKALALAVRVEVELGVRWRDLVGVTDDAALRRLAVQGLQESAVRAAGWRRTAGSSPTVALPGEV